MCPRRLRPSRPSWATRLGALIAAVLAAAPGCSAERTAEQPPDDRGPAAAAGGGRGAPGLAGGAPAHLPVPEMRLSRFHGLAIDGRCELLMMTRRLDGELARARCPGAVEEWAAAAEKGFAGGAPLRREPGEAGKILLRSADAEGGELKVEISAEDDDAVLEMKWAIGP